MIKVFKHKQKAGQVVYKIIVTVTKFCGINYSKHLYVNDQDY